MLVVSVATLNPAPSCDSSVVYLGQCSALVRTFGEAVHWLCKFLYDAMGAQVEEAGQYAQYYEGQVGVAHTSAGEITHEHRFRVSLLDTDKHTVEYYHLETLVPLNVFMAFCEQYKQMLSRRAAIMRELETIQAEEGQGRLADYIGIGSMDTPALMRTIEGEQRLIRLPDDALSASFALPVDANASMGTLPHIPPGYRLDALPAIGTAPFRPNIDDIGFVVNTPASRMSEEEE